MYRFREGFYSDVRMEERFTTSIRYRNGVLEESRQSTVKKAFIRVYDGKMWYYASTYRLSAVQDELDKLYAMATPDENIGESPVVKRLQANRETVIKFAGKCVRNVKIEKKANNNRKILLISLI